MKKKLGYLFVSICSILLVVYLFRYKRALVLEGKIPNTATEIVQIDLRQIEHHLLVDAIKNPFKYISFKSKKKDAISLRKTIVIPRNLLFFTNSSNLKDVWVSGFIDVKNSAKLNEYLLREGFATSNNKNLKLFRKGAIIIAASDEKLLIVYRKQQQISANDIVQTVFKETNFHKKDGDILRSISNSKSDITYTGVADDFFEADFKNGLFEIKGKLHSDLFVADKHPQYLENPIGYLATNINTSHSFFKLLITENNKKKFNNFTKLSVDSIASKWNGRVGLNLKSIEHKINTIVTYDYDDDFNKVEKKSVQEVSIPDLTIELGTQSNLHAYLSSKNAIQVIENDTLFTSIPIYKFYANTSASSFEISTEKLHLKPPLKKKNSKLNAYFNFDKYLQNPLEFSLLPSNNKYIQMLKDASINYSSKNNLSVTVNLKKGNRNFIGQLVRR